MTSQAFCKYCGKEIFSKRWDMTAKFCSEGCSISYKRGSIYRGKRGRPKKEIIS